MKSLVYFLLLLACLTAYAIPPLAPQLQLETHGSTVQLHWNNIPQASGYHILYASYPEAKEIYSMDVGQQTTFNITLPEGAAYYVATTAYRMDAVSAYSNIEFFALEKPVDSTLQTKFEAVLDHLSEQYPDIYGMVASVTLSDGSVWRGVRGKVDRTTGQAVRKTDLFEIGSITKAFTATVILQLMEEGRLKLSDPITNYLTELKGLVVVKSQDYTRQVTIQHLLQHESGIPDFLTEAFLERFLSTPTKRFSPTELVDEVKQHGNGIHKPGEAIAYSNTHYILLGMLIEKLTDQPLEQVFRERIDHPFYLHHTGLKSFDIPLGNVMKGYHETDDTSVVDGSLYWAAGGMISNCYDLERFFLALVQGKFFKKAETLKASLLPNAKGYGLNGIGIGGSSSEPFYVTSGQTLGQITYLGYLSHQQLLVVLSFNQAEDSKLAVAEAAFKELMTQSMLPPWLTSLTDELKTAPIANPPARIIEYQYQGTTVYYVPPKCCDIMGVLYDLEGHVLCHPDGGITGKGDNQCPDFHQTKTQELLIWQDKRDQP